MPTLKNILENRSVGISFKCEIEHPNNVACPCCHVAT